MHMVHSGVAPIVDLDQCLCSGKSLGRLLRPAILALLSRSPGHGYELAQRLAECGLLSGDHPDPSGVYKTLKEMEKEGLVSATWELADTGPAKRRYQMSQEGAACLERWISTLGTYRAYIDGLLALAAPEPQKLAMIHQPCACRSIE